MSENSEHPPDDNEAETKTIEDLPNDSSKSEVKLMNRIDSAMLEDEEMPTYISVSSTSRRDDSDVLNAKQQENMSHEMEEECSPSPYPSDDQAANSVYVLSSGEDSNQCSDEDEEDDIYERENDIKVHRGEIQFRNKLFSKFDSNNMRYLSSFCYEDDKDERDDEDDEDENDDEYDEDEKDDEYDEDEKDDEDDKDEKDEEKELRQIHNNDDDTFDDFELHCDGRSDNFLLNRRIKNRDKEKSVSLQDLNISNNKIECMQRKYSYPCKKYVNVARLQDPMIYSMLHRKQPMLEKYNHIPSKVKLYIKDIKEQNRRSMEKHMKQSQEETIHNKSDINCENNEIKEIKHTNKTIKDYAERTIKELEIAEAFEGDKLTYNASPIILNNQDNKNYLESIHEECTQDARNPVNITDKMQKQNGTIEDRPIKLVVTFPAEVSHENTIQSSLIPNGHQEESPVLSNLRTLSCEEFMHGISSQNVDLNKNAHVPKQEHIQIETYNNEELMDVSINNDDTTCPIKIENIKSIKTMVDEVKNSNEQVNSDKINGEFSKTALNTLDAPEIIALKNQLKDEIMKKDSAISAYKKQVMENVVLKNQINELRKSLAKYEKENKPPEQKVASVQTDFIIDTASKKDHNKAESIHVMQSNNKILGNSIASTLSSIDQWSDSAYNLSTSSHPKPPEVVKTLHSDDSIVLTNDTPVKTTRSLSRTFITSSRILQTLSNITQGKTKIESPLVQNSKRRLSDNTAAELQNDNDRCQIINGSCRPSSSKKRKITNIEPSNFLSGKMSQTAMESHLKMNDTHNESQFKHPCDLVDVKTDSQESSSNINTSQLGTGASLTENVAETADQEDNVKCFVYHENENSKDHSFLIIAKEPTKDKTVNEKRREGGPYRVGNIEIRMSEINGTINIWGKEISQEFTAETENEMETSTKEADDKKHHCWQKTPHTKFNGSNLVCSTSKKCKTPPTFDFSSVVSNFSCTHSPSFNMGKASCSADKAADNLLSPNACVSSCEECELSKDRKELLRYKQTRGQEKLHSCCIHNVDTLEQNCSLHKEKQKFEDNFNHIQLNTSKEHQRSFSNNLESDKYLHKNIVNPASEELPCKCHTVCHNTVQNLGETCQESHKSYNMLKGTCTCKSPMNTDREYNESCNHLSPNLHEEEPLLTSKQCSETPETRRRRLTGKRVRGLLMDLLRGCGDCYNSNPSNANKSCMHKKESHLTTCSPQIKISPCISPEPSCSNAGQPVGRCCHAYSQRIESQLEEFRVEMERVRSRSDAILNMLNLLHSDAN